MPLLVRSRVRGIPNFIMYPTQKPFVITATVAASCCLPGKILTDKNHLSISLCPDITAMVDWEWNTKLLTYSPSPLCWTWVLPAEDTVLKEHTRCSGTVHSIVEGRGGKGRWSTSHNSHNANLSCDSTECLSAATDDKHNAVFQHCECTKCGQKQNRVGGKAGRGGNTVFAAA